MPDLSFSIGEVSALAHAAVPTIDASLMIRNRISTELVHAISLNCQVQLRTLGRTYSKSEEQHLLDLFGERERWGSTMKPLHWANVILKIPPFTEKTSVNLLLPCSLDFDVAANKYFYGLEEGSISVAVMFSGTVFYAAEECSMQIAQIPWDREACFQLSVETWKAAIEAHYSGSAWLRLPHDTFDRLYQYKIAHGIPQWENVINRLLDDNERMDRNEELVESCGSR